jgi:hypothetical protein
MLMAGALVAMAYLYYREKSGAAAAESTAQQDLANTMILLQTMRDVLEEQKELARIFNESIDKKITYIRKAVDGIAAERKRLHTGHAPLESGPSEACDEPLPEPILDADDAPLNVFPDPDTHGAEGDFIDGWAGLDLGRKKAVNVPAPGDAGYEPVNPEEAEHARDAVRSLLDFCGGVSNRNAALVRMPAPGNGTDVLTPALHSRVYEYHDAGMTVPQIAQELGMGKGEIRLMLSLRKDKER